MHRTGVQHISCPDNNITDAGIVAAVRQLPSTPSLHASCDSAACSDATNSGVQTPHLSYLSLRGNKLTAACANSIGTLALHLKLKELSMEDMPIADEGAKQLFDALEHPGCQLETLALHNCSLTDTALQYAQHALATSSTIQVLTLAGNRFSLDAGRAFLKALAAQLPPSSNFSQLTLPASLQSHLQPLTPTNLHIEWI